jgi:phosphoribosylformimino-5-aminoimidazole carboxamide ribotide isomerase
MIVIPAIDLREGACVQLVGGSYEAEKVRMENPVEVARNWAQAGFRRLHLVDLDAATERGTNESAVRDILAEQLFPVQVGGGVRSSETIERLLNEGANWVVAGTRALEDAGWLEEMTRAYPGRIIVAVDVRDRRIVTRGWVRALTRDIMETVDELNSRELGGIMVTAVHLEGQMRGTDLSLMEDVAQASQHPVFASGGISGIADLHALQERGISGAIIGMALYTGALDPRVVAGEFAE